MMQISCFWVVVGLSHHPWALIKQPWANFIASGAMVTDGGTFSGASRARFPFFLARAWCLGPIPVPKVGPATSDILCTPQLSIFFFLVSAIPSLNSLQTTRSHLIPDNTSSQSAENRQLTPHTSLLRHRL